MTTPTTPKAPQPLLTSQQVSELLGVSPSMITRLISSGELPSIKLGRARRVAPSDLDDFIKASYQRPNRDSASALTTE